MRKLLLVVLVIALLYFGGSWCMSKMGSVGSMNSPENTTRSAITALESMESAKVQAYFTPIPGQLMANKASRMYQNLKSLDIQNLWVMLISKEGSAARVEASYSMILTTQLGVVGTEYRSQIIKLVQIDRKWYVNEVF